MNLFLFFLISDSSPNVCNYNKMSSSGPSMLSLFSLEILFRMPVEQERCSPNPEAGGPPRASLHRHDSGRSPACRRNCGRRNRFRLEAAESRQSVGVPPVIHEKVSHLILKLTGSDLLQPFICYIIICNY